LSRSSINRKWNYSEEYYANSRENLERALNQAPFYRAWKKFDPGSEYSVDARYAALPALTKKDIRENFPLGLLPANCDMEKGLQSGEIQLVETSGTTDDKVTNIWNQKWWDTSEKASWKLNSIMNKLATGDHPEAILVNPKNVGIKSDAVDLTLEQRRLGRYLYLNEKTDPLTWTPALMDRMIRELSLFQPVVLEANPSYLARLCRYIARTGQKIYQPGAIVFTYEYPSIIHYRQIYQVFADVPLISSYGTTETGYVFMQCEAGKLHQISDSCRVDFQPFRAEQGGPELGRILVTPFNNPWNSMLRFDTGDIVELEKSGQCSCGRNSALILSSIAGRKVNLTLTCSGLLVTLPEIDNLMGQLPGLEMYKLIQTRACTYQLHLVSCGVGKEKLEKEAQALLKGLYGPQAQIEIFLDSDIAPEGSGKYLLVHSLFPIYLSQYLEKPLPSKAVKEN
jgi:phenylacetate-coenzyme A ligase PaaK-like adenylate-forming protein